MAQKVKLCGMMRTCDIDFANEAMPDYAGFVFADTRRKVSREQAEAFRVKLDKRICAVGVFVDEDVDVVGRLLIDGVIDIAQLHGHEDEAYIDKLRNICDSPVIKAVKVTSASDIEKAAKLPVEYLLLDTYRKGVPGGTGERFDWDIIKEVQGIGVKESVDSKYMRLEEPVLKDKLADGICEKPYFLAGGLNIDNIDEAIKIGAFGLDISSGIETDGYKDRDKMIEIVRRIRNV